MAMTRVKLRDLRIECHGFRHGAHLLRAERRHGAGSVESRERWHVAGPETLSRALKELEQRGAITLKPRLKVVNPDALRQAIGSH